MYFFFFFFFLILLSGKLLLLHKCFVHLPSMLTCWEGEQHKFSQVGIRTQNPTIKSPMLHLTVGHGTLNNSELIPKLTNVTKIHQMCYFYSFMIDIIILKVLVIVSCSSLPRVQEKAGPKKY